MPKELADKFFELMGDFRKILLNKSNYLELSKSELSMLLVIKQFEKKSSQINTCILSNKLHISKSATSQMINILEDKQYIKRIINRNDRRVICVALTEAGNIALEREKEHLVSKLHLVFEKMGEKDSELFVDLLGKYISAFKEII